jgi:hypothetical protein
MSRVYITVNVDFDPEGISTPRSIVWPDGRRFTVDRVISRDRVGANWREIDQRYAVIIAGQKRFIYRKGDRWFVETVDS